MNYLDIFHQLNHIPRPSHHEGPVADFLCQFADNLFEAYEETNMFVIPLTPEGQELTKIMNIKYWQEKLNAITIKKEWRTNNNAYVTFDGTHYDEAKKTTYYHFNFLIPNIARLKKFLYFAESNSNNEAIYCIYCYDFQ